MVYVLRMMAVGSLSSLQKIKAYHKANKGKKPLPSQKIKGYRFILDEEFASLKIDFSQEHLFEIRELVKVKM